MAPETSVGQSNKPQFCRTLGSALGRTRTCGLLIRSQTRSRTGGDAEGHRETKPRLYRQLNASEGTEEVKERHGVVVPLWYGRADDQRVGLEPTLPCVHLILSPPCSRTGADKGYTGR